MKRVVAASFVLGIVALCTLALSRTASAAEETGKADKPAAATADRVVVMYFHRTQRCPTCLKMGSYSEDAVKKGFAEETRQGKVEFHSIDFQDERNAALTKGYKVGGPTLVVAHIVGNKVKEAKSLTEIWTKVRDKDAFLEYIRENVKEYLK